MFNDKDFMGGMFDFDGNGKTTLDEQYVAYKIYEETTKEENDFSSSYHKPAKYSYTNNNSTNSKGSKTGSMIAVVAVIRLFHVRVEHKSYFLCNDTISVFFSLQFTAYAASPFFIAVQMFFSSSIASSSPE